MSLFTGAAVLGAALAGGTAAVTAAKMQTGAASDAAAAQQKSTAEALAFQKSQAENAYQNNETTRHANYDQWAAHEARMGSVGEMLGLKPRVIPAYVPGVDPNLTGGPAAASGVSPSGAPLAVPAVPGATTAPLTPRQLASMAASGQIAPGSANDKLLDQYGIQNPLRQPATGSVGSFLPPPKPTLTMPTYAPGSVGSLL